mmetsp:Transcript_1392/g.5152  ORF Transcript_1392/g.5152 Transcript_1392/m.5152 type:complete len:260 (+) Transcript_1392:446-1225(+)|eukprot:CAMPEP_0170133138 /NCGR_PEP_ID=MMETSP0033_2-20121228/1090_1 /TAXON_ID=195969 /ORGANISM="Dolichomastix tenuilepis, Strain CCMP3274" /LENGTH=259 /DNA_ID=CAMNT_0010368597 /DNA_START=425 /DNA_END=1204 /DNA_ORIENTATION=+
MPLIRTVLLYAVAAASLSRGLCNPTACVDNGASDFCPIGRANFVIETSDIGCGLLFLQSCYKCCEYQIHDSCSSSYTQSSCKTYMCKSGPGFDDNCHSCDYDGDCSACTAGLHPSGTDEYAHCVGTPPPPSPDYPPYSPVSPDDETGNNSNFYGPVGGGGGTMAVLIWYFVFRKKTNNSDDDADVDPELGITRLSCIENLRLNGAAEQEGNPNEIDDADVAPELGGAAGGSKDPNDDDSAMQPLLEHDHLLEEGADEKK